MIIFSFISISQLCFQNMMRGILSTVCNRIAHNLCLASSNRNRAVGFISKSLIKQQNANFTSMVPAVVNTTLYSSQWISKYQKNMFLEPHQVHSEQIRTVIKFSLKKGRRKTVKAVTDRFFRLHWGIWIRAKAGRHKKLWKKSAKRRNNLLHHVFCNATQSKMLDKMVNKFWRKPKHYIEDPYEPYHKRESFYITRTKPWRPEGVDYE